MMELNKLPQEVIKEVKDILGAYDSVNVVFEHGEYHVRTFSCIQASYPDDYKVVGRYHKKDVLTEREQVLSYIENFRSFPYPLPESYRGVIKVDYLVMHEYAEGNITLEELAKKLNI